VRLAGWSTSVDVCLSSCPFSRTVELEGSSRAYTDVFGGDSLEASWSSSDAATYSFEGASCGGGATCYPRWRLRYATADATPDAGDWSENDLVFIRIRRDTNVANNLTSRFLLVHVQLRYTTD
jgi:hypothetical protein